MELRFTIYDLRITNYELLFHLSSYHVTSLTALRSLQLGSYILSLVAIMPKYHYDPQPRKGKLLFAPTIKSQLLQSSI